MYQAEKRTKLIAIIDYGAGNLKSVEKAFAYLGETAVVTSDKNVIQSADKVVLPGVGAFGDAMNKLNATGLASTVKEVVARQIPLLGICLGLQLLFDSSEESPGVEGLGILKGKIVRIPDKEGFKVPHIGWNSLSVKKGAKLFKGIPDQSYVYFVHSYYLEAEKSDIVAATTDYVANIHASVEWNHVFACQFHPEKSGAIGLRILKNFAEL